MSDLLDLVSQKHVYVITSMEEPTSMALENNPTNKHLDIQLHVEDLVLNGLNIFWKQIKESAVHVRVYVSSMGVEIYKLIEYLEVIR